MFRFFNRLVRRVFNVNPGPAVVSAGVEDARRRHLIVREAHTGYVSALDKVVNAYSERNPEVSKTSDHPVFMMRPVLPVVRYVNVIVRRHLDGDLTFYSRATKLGTIFQYIPEGYIYCWVRRLGETELEYIRRCAVEDFNDGSYGSAICQDLYVEVIRDKHKHQPEFPSVLTKERSTHVLESENSVRYRQASNRQ